MSASVQCGDVGVYRAFACRILPIKADFLAESQRENQARWFNSKKSATNQEMTSTKVAMPNCRSTGLDVRNDHLRSHDISSA